MDTNEKETEVWEEEVEDFGEIAEFDDRSNVPHPLVLWIVKFIALLQKKRYIPSAAISPLLKFLYTIFMILSKTTPNLEFFQQFPKSVYQMQRIMDTKMEVFQRYVVCEKCSNIYITMKTAWKSRNKSSTKGMQVQSFSSCSIMQWRIT